MAAKQFLAVVIVCFVGSGRACHYFLESAVIGKRSLRNEVANTSALRQYFANCLTDKVGNIGDWQSIIDYIVLDSLWYTNTYHVFCLGNDTAGCWEDQLNSFVKPSSLIQAGKECLSQFQTDWAAGVFSYTSSSNQLTKVKLPDKIIQGSSNLSNYAYCVSSSIDLGSERNKLNCTSVALFVSQHLEYSCDPTLHLNNARFHSSSAKHLLWPFKFLALTRSDSPLKIPLQECGDQYFPPKPFWSAYGPWSECSSLNGNETQVRTRTCRSGANPEHASEGCVGESTKVRNCNGSGRNLIWCYVLKRCLLKLTKISRHHSMKKICQFVPRLCKICFHALEQCKVANKWLS